jgi:hypothetical protein
LLAHLKMWPLVMLYVTYIFFFEKQRSNSIYLILAACVPVFLFCWFVHFQFAEMYQQMFVQAGKHQAAGGLFQRLAGFLFSRFWPVYKEQPWAIAISLGLLILGIKRLWLSKGKDFFALLFVGTSVVWLFVLAPHYRYWPPLYLLGLVMLSSENWLQKLSTKRSARLAFLCFTPLLLGGFFARHYMALQQRAERDPYATMHWLRTQIDTSKSTLIVGEGIGFYSGSKKNTDFGMEMYPQNLHPEKYDQVYFISRDVHNLKLKSRYGIQPAKLPHTLKKLVRGETYSGLHLYQIQTAEEWTQLTRQYKNDY